MIRIADASVLADGTVIPNRVLVRLLGELERVVMSGDDGQAAVWAAYQDVRAADGVGCTLPAVPRQLLAAHGWVVERVCGWVYAALFAQVLRAIPLRNARVTGTRDREGLPRRSMWGIQCPGVHTGGMPEPSPAPPTTQVDRVDDDDDWGPSDDGMEWY